MSDQTNSFLGTEDQPSYTPTSDERIMAVLSHILCLVSGGIIAPLIIYLVKKDESKFVAAHSKEALNFMITVVIVCFVLFISVIGILLLWVVGIAVVVLVIIASIKASENKLYRYPVNFRFIK